MMKRHEIEISDEYLAAFCRRWQITELALFGFILRDDFGPESDVNFLVTYAPDKKREPWFAMPEADEMAALLGRKVDWLTRKQVEQGRNPIFRRKVLGTAEVIYEKKGTSAGNAAVPERSPRRCPGFYSRSKLPAQDIV